MQAIRIILIQIILIISGHVIAQQVSNYVIKGVITDEVTTQPIIGALVYVKNYEENGTVTNEAGEFKITGLPVGQHTVHATYMGYVAATTVIDVKSGKEIIVQLPMKEEIGSLSEVVISSRANKSRPINSMSYASTRTFSVEESNKFAGAVDDPARMAQSFAGVIPTNDGNNYISVRGNHPSTLLYRIEGIDVPNPNHFGDVASSGGGVSVLSSQVLSDSDFSTGAFSSEYGNAIGGVFDIRLRKGNNSKREYTFKAGFLGVEAALEGPFSKNYKGSYLINYRYSTLSLINKLGVELTGVLNYSDLSYNIHLPLPKGNVSFFGINGRSNQNVKEDNEDVDKEDGVINHLSNGKFISNVSINGGKYNMPLFDGKGFLNATVAYSTTDGGLIEDTRTEYKDYTFFSKFDLSQKNNKLSSAINITHKLNSKMSYRIGGYFDQLGYKMKYDEYSDSENFTNIINNTGKSTMARAFAQLQYRWNEKWSSNIGLHYSHFFLNGKQNIEPRGNIQYAINDKSNVSLAYGKHSQLQPLIVYFVQDGDGAMINKNLDFTKAHHLVLTYHHDINTHTRFKTEVYYQSLNQIPIGDGENNNYAITNQRFFFPDFKLLNAGKGKNMGIEMTLERFMQDNWYYIVTASAFDSKYKTNTNKWFNTRYNNQYVSSVTFGKEWAVGKQKRNSIGLNIKNTISGGQWDTPIDRIASQQARKEIRNNDNPFSMRLKPFYKLDVGIKYKRNKNKYTSTLSLDLMNATNNENIEGTSYDVQNDKINEWTMMPFVPVLSYKIEF